MTEFAVVDNYVDSLARSSPKTQKFACWTLGWSSVIFVNSLGQ